MNLKQFFSILNARKFIFILTLFFTVGTAVALSLILPKQYEASTSIVFNSKGSDPVSGYNLQANMLPGYIATQVEVIVSEKVALKVIDKLGLSNNPDLIRAFSEQNEGQGGNLRLWLANMLLDNIEVIPSNKGGSIVWIQYTSPSPQFSAAVANAFADAYIDTNIELKIEPAQKASLWFKDQVEKLKQNVEVAQKKLTEYERSRGILFSDSRYDVETARLNQLTTAQLQSEEKLFDLETQIKAVKSGDIKGSEDELLDDEVLNNLKVRLSTAEANFAEVKERLNENHPEYKSAFAELTSLRLRLKKELRNLQAKLQEAASREKKRLSQLKEKVTSQKQKLLAMNEDLDGREVLVRDLEVAKQVLSATMERMSQASLEGQADLADVAILQQAVPPTKHSKPKLVVNTVLSVFLGSILAVAFSLLFELMNRLVRTKSDVEEYLDIPVLTEVSKIKAVRI